MKHIKRKTIFIFSILLLILTEQANAVEYNAYDVCYEEPVYEGSSCFDMGGGFKGGIGCKQTIPIRVLSKLKLTNTKIVLDRSGENFSLGFDCGIDGVSKNGESCEEKSGYTMSKQQLFKESIYFNIGEITPSSISNIYSKSNASIAMFTGDNLYASYTKNNIDYVGEIPSCQLSVKFTLDSYEISEDLDGPIHEKYIHPTLVLNRPTDHIVKVTYYTTDDTAKVENGDYPEVTGRTVTIPAGETTLPLDVAIYNDAPIELREWFWVTLVNPYPSSVILGDIKKTKIVISAQEDVVSCFDDDFSNGLDENWRVLKASGGFTPGIVSVGSDHRLRITNDKHNLSTAITKDVVFPSAENLIIIEFDYYAYGGCRDGEHGKTPIYFGADGISNILFDSTVGSTPNPGGFGGSLGYAQLVTPDESKSGFQGGWLGLGLDEYGNYGNCNEGRKGGFSPNATQSCEDVGAFTQVYKHSNTAVIRGDGDGMSGYNFLEGVKVAPSYKGDTHYELDYNGRPQPFIAEYIDSENKPAGGYYSGRYKMKVDSRDPAHLYISLLRSSGGHPEYSEVSKTYRYHTLIKEFDAKSDKYTQGPTPDKVRYAISGSTGIGCNNHELSWIRVKGRCAKFIPETAPAKGIFGTKDVWRNFDDEIISTKIVDKEFKLDIMSLKPDFSGTMKRDGMSVKWALKYMNNDGQARVYGADSNNKGGYQGDWNVSKYDILDNKPFTITEAEKDMWLEIKYCSDYNSTRGYIVGHPYDECLGREEIPEETIAEWISRGAPTSGADYNNVGLHLTLHKGDHFSVRPTHFISTLGSNPDMIKSGHEHNITLTAYSGNKARTKNYNAGLSTIELDAKPKTKNNIFDANLHGTMKSLSTSTALIAEGISSLNKDGSGRHDVLPLVFDDVGKIEFGIIDKTWSNRDNSYGDDSPQRCMSLSEINSIQAQNSSSRGVRKPFSSWICTESNKTITYIPDHFEISASSIQNHNNGDFTYLSKDLNMSANIGLTISAKNKGGVTTSNFSKEEYWYEMPIKVLLNVKKEHPDGNNVIKLDIPNENLLGFTKGTYTILPADKKIAFNYDRFNNQLINPFDVNGTDTLLDDFDISVDITSEYSSDLIIEGEGNITGGSATFFYAKAKPNRLFYEDITSNKVNTPISISIYCDPTVDKRGCNYTNVINPNNSKTDELRWYRAVNHNSLNTPYSDGSVVLKNHIQESSLEIQNYGIVEGSGVPTITPEDIDINSNGIQNGITVSRGGNPTLPMTVLFELETDNFVHKTDSWLLYNEASADEKPDPFYKVRFIDSSSWAGVGDEGNVIDRKSTTPKNQRMNW
ncbi:MSHA biogenesis protein MshQ [hydrothermal vent metagenome]|uniref:MSHA biogenesis protein MshQ n=1 Tax=hydrothermal vent metagenome TaxID=652676 RepID=A0A1W1BLG7_9ZZZZ